MLAFSDPAQAAAVKKSVSSKSAQNFDLKRITAAAAQAPKHPQSGNHSLASVGASSLLHSTHEIEKQFQQLKRDGFRGNPSIELLERMTGEMHNQKRWADKELVMRAKCVAYEKHYGADHPVVACQLESMSEMYKKLNRLSDASKMQTRANSILKAARDNIDATPLYDVHPDGTISERSPMTHDDRIIDLRTRAEVFASHADYETSAAYLKKALAESKAEDGGFTPEDYRNLASFEERLGNDKEAARLRDAAETTY
jgi:HPt (histidine-containing phosphotransfer) domain-containing protein